MSGRKLHFIKPSGWELTAYVFFGFMAILVVMAFAECLGALCGMFE